MFKYVVNLIDITMAMFGPRQESIQEVSETIKNSAPNKPTKPRKPTKAALNKMLKTELLEVSKKHGVAVTKRNTKADIIKAILN